MVLGEREVQFALTMRGRCFLIFHIILVCMHLHTVKYINFTYALHNVYNFREACSVEK